MCAKCLQDTAVQLMLEMHQQAAQAAAGNGKADSSTASFWRSFYAALPPLGTVGGLYGIPPDYLPLIQEPAVVSCRAVLQVNS
jgi:hypothetical protein